MKVEMIGKIEEIYMVGLQVNIIKIMEMVIEKGIVVDDEIVVMEKVVRRRNKGMGKREEEVIGKKEVLLEVIEKKIKIDEVLVKI